MMIQTPSLFSSPLIQARDVLKAGIHNQNIRATIAAQNYVNADSTGPTPGSKPYQRRQLIFKVVMDPKTKVQTPILKKVALDSRPFRAEYRPDHPAANSQGNVTFPNVNSYFEAADFQEANLALGGCAKLYQLTSEMIDRCIGLMISRNT
jgi:flagellar basal-body rod protein FlgC